MQQRQVAVGECKAALSSVGSLTAVMRERWTKHRKFWLPMQRPGGLSALSARHPTTLCFERLAGALQSAKYELSISYRVRSSSKSEWEKHVNTQQFWAAHCPFV